MSGEETPQGLREVGDYFVAMRLVGLLTVLSLIWVA